MMNSSKKNKGKNLKAHKEERCYLQGVRDRVSIDIIRQYVIEKAVEHHL
jgi:hypothetical protein